MIDSMDREAVTIKKDALGMCWHMRGGLTYAEAMNLSDGERRIIADMVKDHMETTKKTGLPYF